MAPRPDLAPDASLSREAMEAQQHEITRAAVFEDDHAIDLPALKNPLAASAAGERHRQPIIAGVDQAFLDERAVSAIVAIQGGEVIERVSAVTPLEIPYIPGLLAFREGGPILEAVSALSVEPDLFLFDGSGRIHFRQAGIATHMGVVLDVPAVGVAKSLLCGQPRTDTDNLPAGTCVEIEANARVNAPEGTVIGHAVQTKQYEGSSRYVNPLYVSPGHRVSAQTAADIVLASTAGYKLPEPTRLADGYAETAKREWRQ